MNEALSKRLQESAQKTLKPKPRMNLVEWADNYRFLSSKNAFPGRWKTSRVEPAREPMLACTDPNVKRVVIMSCTQLLKSELINNLIGYHIHLDPAPMILMQPTIATAQAYSKDRIDPMIEETPVLKDLVSAKKSRDSGNTMLYKGFPGGYLTLVGSNSPSELASRPVRMVLCDEVSRYESSAADEGDPINLIAERTATFFNSKMVICSTPTIKDLCRIEYEYELTDKRVFCAPCPECDHAEELKWENVKWTDDDHETAHYQCPECHHKWSETERKRAISKGFYQATAPFNGAAGFKVNKIASPWEPLSILVKKYLDSKDDPEKYKPFLNTQLAQTYEEAGEAPEHMRLYERRETYDANTCPKGVGFLTAGVDIQKNRIEVEIVGWGKNKESWSIDYRVIMGETTTETPWLELDKILSETWKLDSGLSARIRVMAIDCGYNTQHVYNWARKHPSDRVMVVKGRDNQDSIVGHPKAVDLNHQGKRINRPVNVWPVGVSMLKSELYGYLFLSVNGETGEYPPGYCHFPQYDEEYFKQLTAEQLVTKKIEGKSIQRWVKKYDRNEALDCRVYARAAAHRFGVDRFQDDHWEILSLQDAPLKAATTRAPKQPSAPTKQEPKKETTTSKQASIWGNGPRKSIWR